MRCDVRAPHRRWALGLLVPWAMSTSAAVADGGPIRVLLRGYPRPATIQQSLELLSHACWTGKGLPPVPVPALSDALLRQSPDIETEELFDGERWAKYTITATFVVDPANCQPIVWRSFGVEVIDGCRRALNGSMGSYMPDEDKAPQATVFDRPVNCRSRPAKREMDLSGLPTDDAGLGVQCVWSADIVARALKKPVGNRSGSDTCIYARRPSVHFPSDSKDVPVRMRLDNRNVHGGDIGAMVPMPAELKLVEFSDGSPISPTRFTREAVEAFLRQPYKQAIGATR